MVYYNLYVCAKEGIGRLAPSQWGLMLQRFFIGPPVEAPHLWLVYVIIWLYVLTPFLRYLVQNIPDPVMNGVMLVIFLLNAYVTYVPLFGVTPPAVLSGIVNSYAGSFLLGYYLANRAGKRAENFFLAAGLVSYLITCYVILFHGWYDDYIYNNAPTMMFLCRRRVCAHKAAGALRQQREPLCARHREVQLFDSADSLGRAPLCRQAGASRQCPVRRHRGRLSACRTSHVCTVICGSRHFGSDHHPFFDVCGFKTDRCSAHMFFPKISYSILEHRRDRRGAV